MPVATSSSWRGSGMLSMRRRRKTRERRPPDLREAPRRGAVAGRAGLGADGFFALEPLAPFRAGDRWRRHSMLGMMNNDRSGFAHGVPSASESNLAAGTAIVAAQERGSPYWSPYDPCFLRLIRLLKVVGGRRLRRIGYAE